ncbi:MAG: hypothetical protein V3U73_14830 [bacterium]
MNNQTYAKGGAKLRDNQWRKIRKESAGHNPQFNQLHAADHFSFPGSQSREVDSAGKATGVPNNVVHARVRP